MKEPKAFEEPRAFVKFSEAFVQHFRVSRDEALEQKLKANMEKPETFQKFREVQHQMGTAADDEHLPQELRSALDHPDKFPEFAEAFVQFFVKLTGDESLPQDLERIAGEGRELSGHLQRWGYTEKFEEKLDENEAMLRRQQEQNKHLLSNSREAIVEKARTEIELWIQNYRQALQAGREAQRILQEAQTFAREVGLKPFEEDLAEDPDFIRSYASLVEDRAVLEMNTIHHSVLSFDGLLNQYTSRKNKRNLYRFLFVAFAVAVIIVSFVVGELINQRWTGFAGTSLERVMNLRENRIEMRIPRSAWFPRDLRFPHS